MKNLPSLLAFAALGLIPASLSQAQLICLVQTNGKIGPVEDAAEILLKKTPAYRDGFVKIDYVSDAGYIKLEDVDPTKIQLAAHLTADRTLRDCYAIILFQAANGNPASIVAVQAPDLEAGKRTKFYVPALIGAKMSDGPFVLHFFSGIGEYPTSLIDAGANRDADVLARTESRRPAPILAVYPDRPKDAPADVAGKAVVRCRIDAEGEVVDAVATEASQPGFGQSAVAAAQQWLFAPAIKNHQYVGVSVKIPFIFAPVKAVPSQS
jgi:TonB family protein